MYFAMDGGTQRNDLNANYRGRARCSSMILSSGRKQSKQTNVQKASSSQRQAGTTENSWSRTQRHNKARCRRGVGGVSQVAAGLVRSGNRCVDTFCVLAIWFLFNVLFSHLSFIHPLHSYDIWHTLSPNRGNQHFSICQSLPEEREERWI